MSKETGEQLPIRGIFSVKCIRYNQRAKINHLENVQLKPQEFIPDTLVKDFKIMQHVTGGIYKCNITDIFLMSSKTLPVFYLNVTYERPLQKHVLYRVYFCFTITDDIKSAKQLLDGELNGKFTLEIAIDGKRKEIEDKIEDYPGDNKMYDRLEHFATEQSMLDLTQALVDDIILKKQEEAQKRFINTKPPSNVISLKDYNCDDN